MGYLLRTIRTFADMVQRNQVKRNGRIFEFGSQDVYLKSIKELDAINEIGREIFSATPFDTQEMIFPASCLFVHWGFQYQCCDVDDRPGSTFIDFHECRLPQELIGAFDLVTNHGTTEHTLDMINAFAFAHALARPGGVMWHALPGSGFGNHGFIDLTPKFWAALVQVNGYSPVFGEAQYWPTDELGLGSVYNEAHDFIANIRESATDRSLLVSIAMRREGDRIFFPPLDFYDWSTTITARMVWSSVARYATAAIWPQARLRDEVNDLLRRSGSPWQIDRNGKPKKMDALRPSLARRVLKRLMG